jgi:hypothetical protein
VTFEFLHCLEREKPLKKGELPFGDDELDGTRCEEDVQLKFDISKHAGFCSYYFLHVIFRLLSKTSVCLLWETVI